MSSVSYLRIVLHEADFITGKATVKKGLFALIFVRLRDPKLGTRIYGVTLFRRR